MKLDYRGSGPASMQAPAVVPDDLLFAEILHTAGDLHDARRAGAELAELAELRGRLFRLSSEMTRRRLA